MKTFLEYHKEQEIKEFSQWLESQGYDLQTLDLESLLEAGVWEKAKKWGKGATVAGILGAAALGIMPQGDSDAPSQSQSQSQSQTQAQAQQAQDGISVDGDTITVRTSDKNQKYSQVKARDMLAKHLNTDQLPVGVQQATVKGKDGLWHTTVKLSKSGQAHAAQGRSEMGSSIQPRPGGSLSPDDL